MAIEMDYMEFATNEAAQLAYVSSDIAGYSPDRIPTMTSNTAPSGVASADSEYGSGYFAWTAMDDITTLYNSWYTEASLPNWLQYQFTSGKTITRYTIRARDYPGFLEAPEDWTLKGSNNGSDYDTLDTQTSQSFTNGEKKTYSFANSTSYTYYKLDITDRARVESLAIGEWELMESITVLQCYSEDTIVEQGTYSLKVVAAQTGSLNDTLTKSGLSIDLTDINELKLDVRADRTGSNLQARLYDDVGGWITKDINITSANEFQEFTWDISGVSNANKANISKIEFKILNADSATTYYIDNFYAIEATLELYDITNDFRNAILTLKDTDNKFNSAWEVKEDVINDARFLSEVIKDFSSKFNSAIEVVNNIINDFRSALPTTEGIADYMEYATDEDAQSNYVSSAPFSWDLLNIDCSSLSGWIDSDTDTGVSEVDPAGQFRFDTNLGAAGNGRAYRYKIIGNIPDTFTAEIKLYHNLIGTYLNQDDFKVILEKSNERLQLIFSSSSLFIYDTDSGFTEVGTDLVKHGGSAEWQTWRFVVTYGTAGNGVCDVYLKDSTHDWEKVGTAIPCSHEGSFTDGKIHLLQYGYITDNMVTHIDYIKIGTGSYTSSLQCYSEDTIKQEGNYSLKIEATAGSLNDILTKSGLTSNLTDRNEIKLYVRSDRTGANLQARIHDTGGTWSTKDINITQADVFQEIKWDISGIATADKNYIDKIEFKVINADSDTIYYIDYFTSEEQLYNISNKFNSAIRVLSDVTNDFRSVIEVLKDTNNKFNSAIEIKKDITNKFNSAIEILKNITNDFRSTKLGLYDVSNDVRIAIEELFGIVNNFRMLREVLTDIDNKFRMMIGVNFDNKFNSAIRVLTDISVKFAFAVGVLINIDNDVRTYKLIIPNINNNFRMITSWQITSH